MTANERRALRQLYQFRCGYCGTTEVETGAELTVDHFQPRSRGGKDDRENWVYCCHACNEFKGSHWDPTGARRLLHPLRDDIALHNSEQSDGTWVGLTEAGTFHIFQLRLNRRPMVARRQERRASERLEQAVGRLSKEIEDFRGRLAEIEATIPLFQDRLPMPSIEATCAAGAGARRIYATPGVPEKIGFEAFDDGHKFHGKGAFSFLGHWL